MKVIQLPFAFQLKPLYYGPQFSSSQATPSPIGGNELSQVNADSNLYENMLDDERTLVLAKDKAIIDSNLQQIADSRKYYQEMSRRYLDYLASRFENSRWGKYIVSEIKARDERMLEQCDESVEPVKLLLNLEGAQLDCLIGHTASGKTTKEKLALKEKLADCVRKYSDNWRRAQVSMLQPYFDHCRYFAKNPDQLMSRYNKFSSPLEQKRIAMIMEIRNPEHCGKSMTNDGNLQKKLQPHDFETKHILRAVRALESKALAKRVSTASVNTTQTNLNSNMPVSLSPAVINVLDDLIYPEVQPIVPTNEISVTKLIPRPGVLKTLNHLAFRVPPIASIMNRLGVKRQNPQLVVRDEDRLLTIDMYERKITKAVRVSCVAKPSEPLTPAVAKQKLLARIRNKNSQGVAQVIRRRLQKCSIIPACNKYLAV